MVIKLLDSPRPSDRVLSIHIRVTGNYHEYPRQLPTVRQSQQLVTLMIQ